MEVITFSLFSKNMNIIKYCFLILICVTPSVYSQSRSENVAASSTTTHNKRIEFIVQRIKNIFTYGPEKSFTSYIEELITLLDGLGGYEDLCKDLEYIKYETKWWIILLYLRPYGHLIPPDLKAFLKTIPRHKKMSVFQEMIHFNKQAKESL